MKKFVKSPSDITFSHSYQPSLVLTSVVLVPHETREEGKTSLPYNSDHFIGTILVCLNF